MNYSINIPIQIVKFKIKDFNSNLLNHLGKIIKGHKLLDGFLVDSITFDPINKGEITLIKNNYINKNEFIGGDTVTIREEIDFSILENLIGKRQTKIIKIQLSTEEINLVNLLEK